MAGPERIVVLCTVSAGIDTVAELVRRGVRPAALVGLRPGAADPDEVSGWIDVADAATHLGLAHRYVRSYRLNDVDDRAVLEALQPDLVLVTGWQRLVPDWLTALADYGVLGGHGSPDGIDGGRGRSPQTWALMLGCRSFDLALFRITSDIDAGPVLATRSFCYRDEDDIRVSYFRASLAMADMIAELLASPDKLRGGSPQPAAGFYYPQRRPEDGWVDWSLPAAEIAAHCRALTHPYPGLRASAGGGLLRLWRCQVFDDNVGLDPGTVGPCFANGEFLVHCLDGRMLVRDWTGEGGWRPQPGETLAGKAWSDQLGEIVERHQRKHPHLPISPRIARRLDEARRTMESEA